MGSTLKHHGTPPNRLYWRGLAVIAAIVAMSFPLALTGEATSASAASSPPYSGSYTGTSICTTYGASIGPQIVINGVATNIYECGNGSSFSTSNTPFDGNGSGGGDDSPDGSFQCVELSMRFEYIAYGIGAPGIGGPAVGINTVSYLHAHYKVPVAFGDGSVATPTPNTPAPVAGDVLSLGPTGGSGHTAVIQDVVPTPGTGGYAAGDYTVTIISQNAPATATITVTGGHWSDTFGYTEYNWTLQGVQLGITFTTSPPINAVVGPNVSGGNSLSKVAGWQLNVGQSLSSATGAYSLDMQNDGNLVEYNSASKALWSSDTSGTGSGNYAIMQPDGNFVVYTSSHTAVWNSGTSGTGSGNTLVVQNDGNVVLYPSSGAALWSTGTFGVDIYTPAVTGGGSGNPVTFSIAPASGPVCTVSSGVVTFTDSGTCTIDANQSGSSQVQQSFTVGPENQTITATSTPPVSPTVGGGTYTPTATSSSGLPVTFTLDGTSSGCTLLSGVVTFTAVGTCVIDATQSGTAYTPTSGTSSMTEGQELTAGQQLTSATGAYSLVMQTDGNLVEYNSASKALWSSDTTGTGSANIAALQSDGNFVVYTSAGTAVWNSGTSTGSGNTLVVQGDGNVVLYSSSGKALWNTSTSGFGAYTAAPSVQKSLPIGKGRPTTPAISNLPTSGTYGDHFTAVVRTTGDGITSVTSTSTGVCTASGLVVSFVGVGVCSLSAHVGVGTNYAGANGAAQTFAISVAAKALAANPRTITVTFVAKSSALSPAAKKSLATLAKKLVSGALVTFTGYARGNTGLARSRARNVSSYLSSKVSIHVTLKKVTTLSVNKVTVTTTKQ